MTKKKIAVEIGTLDLESTAISIIDKLQDFVDDYGNDVFVEKEYYPYSEGEIYYAVKANVLETDEQYNSRLQTEKVQNDQREKYNRIQYYKLKEKYGNL